MRNVAVILGVFAAGVGLWVGLARGPGAALAARGQFGRGQPPAVATQPDGAALLAAEGYEHAGPPALPESDAGAAGPRVEGAQVAPAAQRAADDEPPEELIADIDGDGRPDRVWISKVEGRTPFERRLYVEALVGGTHVSAGPYSALGLAPNRAVRRLPPELDDLQLLPPTSLGLADVNLDGRPELVARFSTLLPGRPTLATVLAWDAARGELRELWQWDSHAILCMDATGAGQSAMFSFEIFYPDIPIVRNVSVWDGAQFIYTVGTPNAESAIPASLARRLLDVYNRRSSHVSQSEKSSFDSAYKAAAAAAGSSYAAFSRTAHAVRGLGQR